jgi:hypothetical protein
MRYPFSWQPIPVVPPIPPFEISSLPWVHRVAAVLRYAVLVLEYSLSPGGSLRAWLKLNLMIGIVLGITASIVVPMVTILLAGIASWTALLLQIVLNLLDAALTLMALAFVLLFVTRLLFGRR